MHRCKKVNCILPPHLLHKLLENENKAIRQSAMNTLLATARLRGERELVAGLGFAAMTPGGGRRTIFDCRNSRSLPAAIIARTESGSESTDTLVNNDFEGLGDTREFFKTIFDRESIDNR